MIVHRYQDYSYKGFTLSIRDNKGRLVPFKETELNTQGAFNNYYSDYTEMLEKFETIINTYLMQKEWYPEENEELKASYLNGKNERFFVIEDYIYEGFLIQIDRKESTGDFHGKLYNSQEPLELIKGGVAKNAETLKVIFEECVDNLIEE